MTTWFLATLGATILAAISNFALKALSRHNYRSEVFLFYSGLTSVIVFGLLVGLFSREGWSVEVTVGLIVLSGLLSSVSERGKLKGLRYIDSTIFFPLYKLLGPLFMVLGGLFLFSEEYSATEWWGIGLGLVVPLLLITKKESKRQRNLSLGLAFILLVAVASAGSAFLEKYVVSQGISEMVALWYLSLGMLTGSFVTIAKRCGGRQIGSFIYNNTKPGLVFWSIIEALFLGAATLLIFYAYNQGGALGIVQIIYSFYMVITIILSIIFFREHISWRKLLAIALSTVAVIFVGGG